MLKQYWKAGVAAAALLGLTVFAQPSAALAATSDEGYAGGVFVTGHDPDFHGFDYAGPRHIIQKGIGYVTNYKASPKILLVTDLRDKGYGFRDSRTGMRYAGYNSFDVADYGSSRALDLHNVNFGNYDVIVVASDAGGWLRQEELNVLNSRTDDIITYINNGGGLVAFAESGVSNKYGFLPFLVASHSHVQAEVNNRVTPFGESLGLINGDINGSVSHNIFTASGGMDIVDLDGQGQILSLATKKKISRGGVDSPPVVTATPDHAPNANGWYNSDVTITFTATDDIKVVSVDAPATVTTEGAYQAVTGSATDSGGLVGTATTKVSLDKTLPTLNVTLNDNAVPSPAFFRTESVTAALTASDSLSGLDKLEYRVNGGDWQSYDTPLVYTEEGQYQLDSRVIDKAGNTATNTTTFVIDRTAPVTTIDYSNPGGADWDNDGVIISMNCNKPLHYGGRTEYRVNGGAWQTYTGPINFGTDGVYELEYRSVDDAGNVEEPKSVTVQVDTTAPVVDAALPAPNADGWYNTDVPIDLSATDNLSGVDEGGIEYRIDNGPWIKYHNRFVIVRPCTCHIDYRGTDDAGNTSDPKPIEVKIDKNPPTVKITLDNAVLWPPNHKMVTIHAKVDAIDDMSGVSSIVLTSITSNEPDEGSGDGNTTGDIQGAAYGTFDTEFQVRSERSGQGVDRVYTVTYTVTDRAGNLTVATATVTVPHDMSNKNPKGGKK